MKITQLRTNKFRYAIMLRAPKDLFGEVLGYEDSYEEAEKIVLRYRRLMGSSVVVWVRTDLVCEDKILVGVLNDKPKPRKLAA